jgi:DNA-binding CsgD family transcriptional regulator/tetratricopeptide (TPR) repeat protein
MSANEGSPGTAVRRPLIGRERESAILAEAVRAASGGGPGPGAGGVGLGALVLRGEPGSGRTQLLETALIGRPETARLVRITGVAAESRLPGAAVHRLLSRLGGRLPGPGPLARGAGVDQLGLSLAVFEFLSRAADDGPLICLIDDADDLDRLSLHVLGFAGRRLAGRPALILIATTATGQEPAGAGDPLAGLPELVLDPLDETGCRQLLLAELGADDPAEVPDYVLAGLADLARGNPLALVELAGSLTAGQRAGLEPLPTGLPLGSRLRRHHRDRLEQQHPGARLVLLLAAAQQPLDLDTLLRAVQRAGFPPEVIDAAVEPGLLRIEAGQVLLTDGLLRASCYAEAGVSERLAVHRLLAEVLDHDSHRLDRAWHQAMSPAAAGLGETLADQLHTLGTAAAAAGDQAGASRCLERAAGLSVVPGRAAAHLLAAARAAWNSGDVRRARLLLGRGRLLATTAELRAVIDLLLGEIELRSGTVERAYEALTVVGDGLSGPLRAEAVVALLRASEVYMLAGDHARFLSAAHRIGSLARPDEEPLTRLMFEQFEGFSASYVGDHQRAATPLRNVVELGPLSRDPSALILATIAAMTLGDELRSHALAGQAVTEARARADGGHLPVALEFLAFAEFWAGHYPSAQAHSQEGLALAAQAGQQNTVAAHLAIQALLSTVPGDCDKALLRAQVAARQADGRGLYRPQSLTIWAAVRMALAGGRPDNAIAALRAVSVPPGTDGSTRMHLTIRVMATPDLIEAAVKLKCPEWVPPALATFENWAGAMDSRAMLALAARCRALLSSDDEIADEQFREALRLHDGRDLEFERARTQLLYGLALRRRRRPARAREHLHEALEVFDGLDARGWAAQARAELRAAGGVSTAPPQPISPTPAPGPASPPLTPQQAEIARLVAGGATNREIAAQLFLSPRTVDHHLRNIFVRLGVRSRVELTRLVS